MAIALKSDIMKLCEEHREHTILHSICAIGKNLSDMTCAALNSLSSQGDNSIRSQT